MNRAIFRSVLVAAAVFSIYHNWTVLGVMFLAWAVVTTEGQ